MRLYTVSFVKICLCHVVKYAILRIYFVWNNIVLVCVVHELIILFVPVIAGFYYMLGRTEIIVCTLTMIATLVAEQSSMTATIL